MTMKRKQEKMKKFAMTWMRMETADAPYMRYERLVAQKSWEKYCRVSKEMRKGKKKS